MPDVSEFMEQRQPRTVPMALSTREQIVKILERKFPEGMSRLEIRQELANMGITTRLEDIQLHLGWLCRSTRNHPEGRIRKKYNYDIGRWVYQFVKLK